MTTHDRSTRRSAALALRLFSLTVLLAGASACGRDGLPGSPAPAVALSLELENGQANATAGGSPRALDVALTRAGNVGAVTLSVTGLPVGVTATFMPSVLPPGTNSATLVLTAVSAAQPGEYQIAVRAESGETVTTAPFVLVVQPQVGFTVAVESWSPIIRNGDTVQGTLRVTREGGYAGPVTWSAGALPPGFSAAFSSPAVDPEDAAIERTHFSLFARSTVLPQDYTALLTAAGPDSVPSRTATLNMLVPPRVGGIGGGVEVRDMPAPNQDSVRLEFYTSLQVNRGGTSASRTVRVRRLPPYDGPIFLSGSDTLGYSFSFSRTVIPPGDSTAMFTVSAVPGVPSELLTLGVTASAVGAAPMVVLVLVSPVPFQ